MTEHTAARIASALERIAAALEARNAEEGVDLEAAPVCPTCGSDEVVRLFGERKVAVCKHCGAKHERGA
jgi:ribosomal protein L37AE/L43A